jgi:outer membrane protein OmpA-like peptidoglycan-associated protein
LTKFALLATACALFAFPAFAQTVGNCPAGAGASPAEQPAWVLFDLGSAVLKPEARPAIADAAQRAKARQAVSVCVIGQTDKLGDKNYNAQLAMQRSQAVAAELIRDGVAASKVIIAANGEAFGNLSFGARDAQEKDRRVTIVMR